MLLFIQQGPQQTAWQLFLTLFITDWSRTERNVTCRTDEEYCLQMYETSEYSSPKVAQMLFTNICYLIVCNNPFRIMHTFSICIVMSRVTIQVRQ